jgi:hypothetical protein
LRLSKVPTLPEVARGGLSPIDDDYGGTGPPALRPTAPFPGAKLILHYTDASSCTKIHIRTGHTAHLVIKVPNLVSLYSHSHIVT